LPISKRKPLAESVYAAEKPTQLMQVIEIVELRRPPALARINRKLEVVVTADRRELPSGVDIHRRHYRYLVLVQVTGQSMLLVDLFETPASRPVKLGDHRFPVVDSDLVNAVLVAVEREYPGVAEATGGLDRTDHPIRSEARIGMG
jgi:hypothetical protein